MSEHDKLPFPFFPRPEAHRMIWAHLQPPVQKAIRGLLHRIEGATQKSVKIPRMTEDDSSEIAANCFLVYGDRGTGKTSVLLGAKYACEDERFFGSADDVRVRDDRVRVMQCTSPRRLRIGPFGLTYSIWNRWVVYVRHAGNCGRALQTV